MLIKNLGVSIIHVPLPKRLGREEREKLPAKFQKGVTFLPGNNDVPPEVMEIIGQQSAVRNYFEGDEPRLRLLERGPKKAAQVNTVDMKEGDAVKVVKETVDKDLLERWLATEKRGQVVHALRKQLKAIEPPNKDKGNGGDKQEKDEGGAETGGAPTA